MNCKKDQMAWIKVPRQFQGSGLEQLNGHVVKTVAVAPGHSVPTWEVTPPQRVHFKTHCVDASGRLIKAGEVAETALIPDSFLRPFDPNSEPSDELESRELEHTV